jgi:hypothetical protein
MKYGSTILLLPLCVLLASACSNQAVYSGESFSNDSPFKMRVDGEVAQACESARRSLLGQGYLIENADSEGIKSRKAIRTEDNPNTFIEMNVVCLPETSGSTLFATGVVTTYALKKSSSSASVGLSALGSISLPIGQSADSLVKVSEETIDDKEFYGRFFAAVGNILAEMRAGNAPPEPAAEPAVAETVPATAAQPAELESAPVAVPEPPPGQEAAEFTLEPVVNQAVAIRPDPSPADETPVVSAESSPVQDASMVAPEHAPAPPTEPSEWHYDE